MDTKKLFEKYRSRLVKMGIVKSLGLALLIGFTANFIIAFVCWLFFYSNYGIWIATGVFLGIVLILTPLLYFKRYRPTTKKIARLVDKLGLEERLITMYELEHDESYIAMAQREDARSKLQAVNEKSLKMNIPRLAVIMLCIVAVLGIGMTSLNVLTVLGVVPSWDDLIDEEPDPVVYTVTYSLYGTGGVILGDMFQMVKEGEDATPVFAEADDGYVFMGWHWTDENNTSHDDYNPYRCDTNIQCNLEVIGQFEYFDEIFGDDDEQYGESGPSNPDDEYQAGGIPSDTPSPPDDNTQYQESIGTSDNTTTGKEDNDTVLDGATSFDSEFDYESSMDDLSGDNNAPPRYKGAAGSYFEGMK